MVFVKNVQRNRLCEVVVKIFSKLFSVCALLTFLGIFTACKGEGKSEGEEKPTEGEKKPDGGEGKPEDKKNASAGDVPVEYTAQ